ncbi:MAG: SUMF1/EgtB/PvdO family nonheme iron enzyme [Deltaproteobacteria bacterium]|nr:MAG: SUMF1/EgtB/PvdO family nonheme iron enzyme [Deltaproteobacteria bacterium]
MTKKGKESQVVRGGSWNNNDPDNLRTADRNNNHSDNRNKNIGFRCARGPQYSYRRKNLQIRVLIFKEIGSVW